MSQTAVKKPIDYMLEAFPQARVSTKGDSYPWYSARCSAHNDKSASLSFRETEEGTIIIKCFAGCNREAVIEAAGLKPGNLYPKQGYKPAYKPQPKLDLVDLAYDKLIPWQYLFKLGVEDDYRWQGMKCCKITYYDEQGNEHPKVRVRIATSGNKGSRWDEDTPGELIPYGLHKLDMGRQQKFLLIGEGESDAWTCWLHDIPYLGVPGATNEKCLQGKMLNDIPHLYIIQEPDNAGRGFYKSVHRQLRSTGYTGAISALPFKNLTGRKDPNDLHKALRGQGFKEAIIDALQHAIASGDATDGNKKSKVQTFRLCDLQDESFPDLKWAIPDLLPEGLTWLCGKPKLGKSWMLLSMMCAIAVGGVALGNVPVEEGEVLYLSLEDNKRRLKTRANTVMSNLKASPNFHYAISWPRLNEGGLEALEEWIIAHPNVRLIGIDTWAKFKPRQQANSQKQQYDEDYDALTPLQELAGKYNISIVIVHHMRKQESEDPLDGVAGSVALQGAVDGFLLLYRKRGETDARLFITGRDIEEEQELVLGFEQQTASWKIKGNADEVASTPERQAILDVLKQHPDGWSVKQIAGKLNKNVNTTRNLLVSLRNDNKVLLKNNLYIVVTHSKSSNDSNPSKSSKQDSNPTREEPENTEGYYGTYYDKGTTYYGNASSIVTPGNTVNEPVKPSQTTETTSPYYGYYANYSNERYSTNSNQGIKASYEQAKQFFMSFTRQPGYALRLRPDGTIGIGVPEDLSDAEFEKIRGQVLAQSDDLKRVLRDQESA